METIESQEAVKAQEQPNPEGNLIVAATGLPFKTETAAKTGITKLGLNPGCHRVIAVVDGYAIQRPEPDQDIPIIKHVETYFLVKFNAKSNSNDENDVMLSVNGETLIFQRGKEVFIPYRFLDCADHTTRPHFQQLPNKPRKVIGTIMTFPYTKLREATKQEYESQRKAGTKQHRANVLRYGFDLDPGDISDGQQN